MSDGNTRCEGPTRRQFVGYGSVAVAGGLAGCVTGDPGRSDTDGEGTYEVCLDPVGCQAFETPPERYVTYKEATAEMAILAGGGDGLVGIDRPDESLRTLDERFYREIPGLSVDVDGVDDIRGGGEQVDKETFYEIDADCHLIDPNEAMFRFEWDEADLKEIATNVAPFFGHSNRRYSYDWQDGYERLDLFDVFEKIAAVFEAEDRYQAFREVHDEMLTTIDDETLDDTPEIGLLNGGSDTSNGEFYPLDPHGDGYEMRQYREIGVTNAFAGAGTGDGAADYETLLDVDPDIIVYHWGILETEAAFRDERIDPMRDHPVGSQLTAVQNDRIYPGGTAEQGPLTTMFQTELLAQQLWPEEFGDTQLFDRERVGEIVTGDI